MKSAYLGLSEGLSAVVAMNHSMTETGGSRGDDAIDLAAEARLMRRRMMFWRRAAWLLLVIVIIILVVAWQRAELRRRDSRASLLHYAEQARAVRLAEEPPELLELQWQRLERGQAQYTPSHYSLIVSNWGRKPLPGESLPLAVSSEPESTFIGSGRHVLFAEVDGDRVEWLSEEEAKPIVASAESSSVLP
jgi:hypothetical protein